MANNNLSKEDLHDLHEALCYYGKANLKDAAYSLFHRDETPLPQYWQTENEFLNDCFTLKKLARGLSTSEFSKAIRNAQIPESVDLMPSERDLITDKKELLLRCQHVLDFVNKLPDLLEYDISLMESGYPYDSAS